MTLKLPQHIYLGFPLPFVKKFFVWHELERAGIGGVRARTVQG
jgi:hypothetical protein